MEMITGLNVDPGAGTTHFDVENNVNNLGGLELMQQPDVIENNGVPFDYTAINDTEPNYGSNTPVDSLEMLNNLEVPKTRKVRRYWSHKEEALLFEIWGRENKRLSKHGKNTPYFAEWVTEFKEKHNIDIKLEEIQCKVTQMKSKYRSIQRLIETNKAPPTWKKYNIISKILNNEYQPRCLEQTGTTEPQITSAFACSDPPSKYQSSLTTPCDTFTHSDPFQRMLNNGNWERFNCPILPEYNASYNTLSAPFKRLNSMEIDRKPVDRNTSSFDGEVDESTIDDLHEHQSTDDARGIMDSVENFVQELPNSSKNYVPAYSNEVILANDSKIIDDPKHHLRQPSQEKDFNDVNHNDPKVIDPFGEGTSTNCKPFKSTYCNNQEVNETSLPNNLSLLKPPRKDFNDRNTSIEDNYTDVYRIEELYLKEVREKNSILSDQRQIAKERLQLEKRKISLLENFLPKYLNLQQQILQNLEKLDTETVSNSGNQENDDDANESD